MPDLCSFHPSQTMFCYDVAWWWLTWLTTRRFDGDVIKTDETIRTLAQKWQPTKRPRSEERSTKAVDTDMIVVPCVVSTALHMT